MCTPGRAAIYAISDGLHSGLVLDGTEQKTLGLLRGS